MHIVEVGTQWEAFIDDEDYDLVSQFRWYRYKRKRNRTAYAYRVMDASGNPVTRGWRPGSSWQYMHQLITGFNQTDHLDGNGLNNQRFNLRDASNTNNRANTEKQRGSYTSQYKGVCWDKYRSKWGAKIQVAGKQIFLGRFDTEKEAALAYNVAAQQHFGEYALLNFLDDLTEL